MSKIIGPGPNGEAVPYRDTMQGLIERIRALEAKVDELKSLIASVRLDIAMRVQLK